MYELSKPLVRIELLGAKPSIAEEKLTFTLEGLQSKIKLEGLDSKV